MAKEFLTRSNWSLADKAACVIGLAWIVYFGWVTYHEPVIKDVSEDYLYEQQQTLQNEVDQLKRQIGNITDVE